MFLLQGASCTECDGDDLVLGEDFECTRCLPVWQTVLSLLAGGIIFGLFIAYKLKDRASGYASEDVYLKIVVSAFQLNGLALSYGFDWGELMAKYLQYQGSVSSLGTAYIELQCLREHRAGSPFVMDSLMYLFFVPVFFLVVSSCRFLYLVAKPGTHSQQNYKALSRNAGNTALGAGVLVMFILQPVLVERAALVFSCVQMGSGQDTLFMTEDLSVRCWGGQHWLYVGTFGVGFILFYVIGIPAALYYVLTSEKNLPMVRHIISDSLNADGTVRQSMSAVQIKAKAANEEFPNLPKFYKNYAFLFMGYTEANFCWEVVVISRKALISLIGVVLSTDQRAQCMLGMMVIFVSTVLHANYKPFCEDWLNHFEFLSLTASALTFFFGMFTLESGSTGQVIRPNLHTSLCMDTLTHCPRAQESQLRQIYAHE